MNNKTNTFAYYVFADADYSPAHAAMVPFQAVLLLMKRKYRGFLKTAS
jgi:hypothetical protein